MNMSVDQINARMDEIANMPFDSVAGGYAPQQVDEILEELMGYVDDVIRENQNLQQQLAVAKAARPAAAPVVQPTVTAAQPSAGT